MRRFQSLVQRPLNGHFPKNANGSSICSFYQRRLVSSKTTVQEPLTATTPAKSPQQSTTAITPAENLQQPAMPTGNHATAIMDETTRELRWIPPKFMLESRTKKTRMQKLFEDEEWRNHLPPAPRYNLNMSDPVDRKTHQDILDSLDKHLPKWDILRIPVWTSKPWFDYVLWSYLAFVAGGIVLFGNWDDASEGEDHVFSGIRRWVFGTWHSLTSVSTDDVQQLFHAQLENRGNVDAVSPTQTVSNNEPE